MYQALFFLPRIIRAWVYRYEASYTVYRAIYYCTTCMSPPSYNFVIIGQPLTNTDTLTLALMFYILSPFLCTPTMNHYIHYFTTHPLCLYLMLSSLKPATVFLPTYGIGVPNMQTVLSEHTTHSHDKLLQPYVWMAALCCTTSQQSPKVRAVLL